MAHEIDMSNDRANMAYVGMTPWHGLGQQVDPDLPFEDWIDAAGFGWDVVESPTYYNNPITQTVEAIPGRKTLLRSDTGAPLSVMSTGFKAVQPRDILEFYRDLVDAGGFRLHTAGSLQGGKKIWALAEIGEEARIMGQDRIDGYLLLATGCDGMMATRAMFTTVRVVCQNTLQMSVAGRLVGKDNVEGKSGMATAVRIPHSRKFNPDDVKAEMGLAHTSFKTFTDTATELAKRKVSDKDAVEFMIRLIGDPKKPVEEQPNPKVMKQVLELFKGAGKGSNLKSADGTAWGLVNSVTEYLDHIKGRSNDARLTSAWFGDGAVLKQKAMNEAVLLLAA